MRKILVFGNSGSGKSTLAKQLCTSEGLAHLDLDTLAWEPTPSPTRKPLEESSQAILEFIRLHDGWVIEGCYTDLLEIAAKDSTEIIFLNLPVESCMANARSRPWEPHKYESVEAQNANLEMLMEWIAQYEKRNDAFSWASHMRFYTNTRGKRPCSQAATESCSLAFCWILVATSAGAKVSLNPATIFVWSFF